MIAHPTFFYFTDGASIPFRTRFRLLENIFFFLVFALKARSLFL